MPLGALKRIDEFGQDAIRRDQVFGNDFPKEAGGGFTFTLAKRRIRLAAQFCRPNQFGPPVGRVVRVLYKLHVQKVVDQSLDVLA